MDLGCAVVRLCGSLLGAWPPPSGPIRICVDRQAAGLVGFCGPDGHARGVPKPGDTAEKNTKEAGFVPMSNWGCDNPDLSCL